MEFKFDLEENKDKIDGFRAFIKDNKSKKGAVMLVLQKAQGDFGYLPVEILEIISKDLNTPLSEIYGVATFYSQFSFIPKGENIISVCLGTACYVKGAEDILSEIENSLEIKRDATTPDLKFSITATRCIGDCGMAPVITINDDVYGKLKTEDIKGILDNYK